MQVQDLKQQTDVRLWAVDTACLYPMRLTAKAPAKAYIFRCAELTLTLRCLYLHAQCITSHPHPLVRSQGFLKSIRPTDFVVQQS